MSPPKERVRIAAIGDLHYARPSRGSAQPLLARIADEADILLICGDLTDYGLPEEARLLAREISGAVKIPIVAVLGNHDYEAGAPGQVREILSDAGIVVLDGETCEIHGVGFAGIKGFGGGFGRGTLGPWGEQTVKAFVREAVDEALKLETALARLRAPHRVALLHYAPIAATVEGEPREIFPFLGCSRLEEPLTRFPVTAVFHGHAHHGRPEGRTRNGVPVFNVSLSLMRAIDPAAVLQKLSGEKRGPGGGGIHDHAGRRRRTSRAGHSAGPRRAGIAAGAPVTSGSEFDPLPIGKWKVTGIARRPAFHYNPDSFWDADPSHAKATIKPGSNNPVGSVWIDISKPHYGLHGSPEPSRIGKSESHGCVRLTNWDALRLAALVRPGTP